LVDIFASEKYVEEELIFKEGAQVMITKNIDFQHGIINGARGTIWASSDKEEGYYYLFKPETEDDDDDDDLLYPIYRTEEFHVIPYRNIVRKQFPFVLAYGGTIHKWQGQEMDEAIIECQNISFQGQFYTALSR
jgi:ATP-dependent exoDNAse (exonuclease V) alpha subunit